MKKNSNKTIQSKNYAQESNNNLEINYNNIKVDLGKLTLTESPTERLYQRDVYMKEACGEITGITPLLSDTDKTQDLSIVTFNKSPFFPEGGGQPSDIGYAGKYKVIYVFEKGDTVYHVLESGEDSLSVGSTLPLKINWTWRFKNMQRHHGEHILSGIFFREYGGINTGFHMGDKYMTIDITLPGDSDYDEITWEMAKHCEYETNKIIWQNLPIVVERFDTRKEAEAFPMRKALKIEKDISLVAIDSLNNGWSNVACCGTHPSSTGQVGLLKIFKVEKNKGMFRIYFEAGEMAFLKYQNEMDVLNNISAKLSAGTDDLIDKFQTYKDKQQEKANHLHLLKKEILRREVEDVKASLSLDDSNFLTKYYSILEIDDVSSIAKDSAPFIKKLGFFIHKPSSTIFLASDGKIDCNKLVKSTSEIYGGKGGGSSTLARIILPKSEYVELYIDLVNKHLR